MNLNPSKLFLRALAGATLLTSMSLVHAAAPDTGVAEGSHAPGLPPALSTIHGAYTSGTPVSIHIVLNEGGKDVQDVMLQTLDGLDVVHDTSDRIPYVSGRCGGHCPPHGELDIDTVDAGVALRATPRLMDNGKVALSYRFDKAVLSAMRKAPSSAGPVDLPEVERISVGGSVVVSPDVPTVLSSGQDSHGAWFVKATVTVNDTRGASAAATKS
ncbi:hypothetical protein [Paraburkholderia sp. J8-2]|uniref:hypothetical protein n=1 Tax=Paraburkholderia sp. J8-2 TaxID=2805440 RepID=UPI002AB64781|nr:hypothetical protein [Paraburkholderia sp. J8-2]